MCLLLIIFRRRETRSGDSVRIRRRLVITRSHSSFERAERDARTKRPNTWTLDPAASRGPDVQDYRRPERRYGRSIINKHDPHHLSVSIGFMLCGFVSDSLWLRFDRTLTSVGCCVLVCPRGPKSKDPKPAIGSKRPQRSAESNMRCRGAQPGRLLVFCGQPCTATDCTAGAASPYPDQRPSHSLSLYVRPTRPDTSSYGTVRYCMAQ